MANMNSDKRASSSPRNRFTFGALVAFLFLGLSCSDSEENGNANNADDGFDRNTLLRSVSAKVIAPFYAEARSAADKAVERAEDYRSAVGGTDEDAALDEVQQAWRELAVAWQRTEPFQLGPAGAEGTRMEGANLRDEVYSWPTLSACLVDRETAAEGYASASFFGDKLVTAYGIDAAEALIFATGTGHRCPEAPEDWDDLAPEDVTSRRAAYAVRVFENIRSRIDEIASSWAEGNGENYRAAFENAGENTRVFGSAQEAIDELFAAFFYIELRTKDDKLGIPAGLHMDCPEASCPEEVESQFAGYSLELILANLEGARAAFRGTAAEDEEGVGFDDFLRARGAAELADSMQSGLDAAIEEIEALESPLRERVESDLDEVQSAFETLRGFTDLLRADFVTVLNLSVPQEGAADND